MNDDERFPLVSFPAGCFERLIILPVAAGNAKASPRAGQGKLDRVGGAENGIAVRILDVHFDGGGIISIPIKGSAVGLEHEFGGSARGLDAVRGRLLAVLEADGLDHAGFPRDIRPLHDPIGGKITRQFGPDFCGVDVEINAVATGKGDDVNGSGGLVPILGQMGHGVSMSSAVAIVIWLKIVDGLCEPALGHAPATAFARLDMYGSFLQRPFCGTLTDMGSKDKGRKEVKKAPKPKPKPEPAQRRESFAPAPPK